MRIENATDITEWLKGARSLSEALLHEMSLARFGYSVHIVFSVVTDSQGQVLTDLQQVVLDLEGVERLGLHGGLTARMLEHPEEIGWGLSEVAFVTVSGVEGGVHFEAFWEGDRKLDVLCRRAALTVA